MLFIAVPGVPSLYVGSTDDGPPPGGGRAFYLLPPGQTAGPTLDLPQSWSLPGAYLFLEEALPAERSLAFAAAAARFLSDPSFAAPRIAWFPTGDPTSGALDGYVLAVAPEDVGVSGRVLVVSYRNYAVIVGIGTPVGLDAAAEALTLAQTAAGTIAVSTGFGAATLAGAGSISVPLGGDAVGCLRFVLTLRDGDLDRLDVGLRNYHAAPDGEGALVSLRYPVFATGSAPVLQASLSPTSDAEARTRFLFVPGATLTSCYASVAGYPLSLAPMANAGGPSGTPAQLVLAPRPASLPPSPDDLYTLVPKGDFTVGMARATAAADPHAVGGTTPSVVPTLPADRMMCGLSGVEYVGLDGGTGALSFFTGRPAFARGFAPDGSGPVTLTDDATTAWGVPRRSGHTAPTYYAQPDRSVLFQPPAESSGFGPLLYLEVGANALSAAVSAATAVPLFPYRGVTDDGSGGFASFSLLESKVLSPRRRDIVRATGGPPPAAVPHAALVASAPVDATTPQGLLAHFSDSTLAMMDRLVLATMETGATLAMHELPNGAPIRTALASNQLFLVITDPDAATPHLSADAAVTIEGWTFSVDPKAWPVTGAPGLKGTALIFKFAAGALVDLVRDTSTWARAGAGAAPFNRDDGATAARIGTILDEARRAYEAGDLDYAEFVRAVTDPSWRGILILDAAVSLTQLPDQCRGLAAGIDPSTFFGHHVGVELSKVRQDGRSLKAEPSSMFALIAYGAARVPVVPDGAPYQFQVDSLKVLFKNSAIAGFASTVELLAGQLFGDAAAGPAQDHVILLYGVLQRQVIAGVPHDTYLFATRQNDPHTFAMLPSSVLARVQVASAQFVTEQPNADGLTHTHFALAGILDFRALDGLDLFSFGAEAGAAVAGLQVSKALVRMVFDPAVANSAAFAFDAGGLAFDVVGSASRADSLFEHFPLALASFVQSQNVVSPTDMGFMGVQSPLTQSKLQVPWYGLAFTLNLGSLGALAAKAGFTATLLAAWSPSAAAAAGAPRLFLGLKLPGSDGAKGGISLEGVLTLGFRAMVLGRNGPSTYYLLLNALALRVMGLSFPPGAQIDMALFGDPGDAHNSALGWYAAYTKDQASNGGGAKDRAARTALRATARDALMLGGRDGA